MVKLEREDGSSVYVRPESVRSISASGVEGCSTVWLATESYVVKGDPDEVHAALFPAGPPGPAGVKENAHRLALDVLAYEDRLPRAMVERARRVAAACEPA